MSTIVIAGGTGLLGRHLSQLLSDKGYEVRHLSRKRNLDAKFPAYSWNLNDGSYDKDVFQNIDYVINLAGANLADSRWTPTRKKAMIESRTKSTSLLKMAIEKLDSPPKAYISASAIGFYGDKSDEILTEKSPSGEQGFLPECVVAWENAIGEIRKTGIRTITLRIGIILSTKGGALKELLFPFNFFLGTYFGNGKQWYSWIHIDDMAQIVVEAIENPSLSGTYNATAPQPTSCKAIVLAIKNVLNKPALILSVPAFLLKMVMGEMSTIILDSTRVSSEKIQKAGFEFKFPALSKALEDILTRKV